MSLSNDIIRDTLLSFHANFEVTFFVVAEDASLMSMAATYGAGILILDVSFAISTFSLDSPDESEGGRIESLDEIKKILKL